MAVPAMRARRVPTTMEDSSCSCVRAKIDRARRSASTDWRISPSTRSRSWASAAATRTAIRLLMVSEMTPVAFEW